MTLNELVEELSGMPIYYYVGACRGAYKETDILKEALSLPQYVRLGLSSRLDQFSQLIEALAKNADLKVQMLPGE